MKVKETILEIRDFFGKSWRSIVHWLEKGDLVPLLVLVSAFHYVPVLREFDHFVSALAIGLLVDIGHFRTVRIASRYRYKKAKKNKDDEKKSTKGTGRAGELVLRWLLAVIFTGLSFYYHLMYYDYNVFLALPLPLLIMGLAYFAQKDKMGTASTVEETEEEQVEAKVSDNGNTPFFRYCISCNKYAYNAKQWAGHCRSLEHKAYVQSGKLEVLNGELR